MATDEMFESASRAKGDLAGVFEHDGDTGYFYLYQTQLQKVLGAIHILTGAPDFTEGDVAVRWDRKQEKVGLSIRDHIWAVFDGGSPLRYGGDYVPSRSPTLPSEACDGF